MPIIIPPPLLTEPTTNILLRAIIEAIQESGGGGGGGGTPYNKNRIDKIVGPGISFAVGGNTAHRIIIVCTSGSVVVNLGIQDPVTITEGTTIEFKASQLIEENIQFDANTANDSCIITQIIQ